VYQWHKKLKNINLLPSAHAMISCLIIAFLAVDRKIPHIFVIIYPHFNTSVLTANCSVAELH
jgi:hypothetical protein